jgi:ribosome-binding factor A
VTSRRGRGPAVPRRYPRSARVNEVLREILAEELERMSDADDRLGLLTVTAVQCDPDLRHARVLFSSLGDAEAERLEEIRIRLQATISRQVHMRRTPLLSFHPDPAVAAGNRIDDILRDIPPAPPAPLESPDSPDSPDPLEP